MDQFYQIMRRSHIQSQTSNTEQSTILPLSFEYLRPNQEFWNGQRQGWSLTLKTKYCLQLNNYQPNNPKGTHSRPATLHLLKNPKRLPGTPNWTMGSGKGSTPRFFGAPVNFCKIVFFYLSTSSVGKVNQEGKKSGGKNRKKLGLSCDKLKPA